MGCCTIRYIKVVLERLFFTCGTRVLNKRIARALISVAESIHMPEATLFSFSQTDARLIFLWVWIVSIPDVSYDIIRIDKNEQAIEGAASNHTGRWFWRLEEIRLTATVLDCRHVSESHECKCFGAGFGLILYQCSDESRTVNSSLGQWGLFY